MRSKITLRMPVSGMLSGVTPAFSRLAARGSRLAAAMARSTSSRTMRPSGPVPLSVATSIPCSCASFLATGEIFTRSPGARTGPLAARGSGCATPPARLSARGSWLCPLAAATGAAPRRLETSSPASPMTAIRLPTGSSAPSCTTTLSRVPAAGDSTSYSTLSVWMRTTG